MKLISWNVNGVRAAIRKGFWEWLSSAQPDILCLQETRIAPDQLSTKMLQPTGYHASWCSAERRGYSGVATLCRQKPSTVRHGLGVSRFDVEGRVLVSEHEGFTLVNSYFPSGQRGQERVAYKLDYYAALLAHCQALRAAGHRLVVCGDFNTAHQPIDLARPKQNRNTSGFLPEEREAFGNWIEEGFVDVFRLQNPDAIEYTWWTYRANARARNVGWRLDYFLLTKELAHLVKHARILGDVTGSDHCPVEIELAV